MKNIINTLHAVKAELKYYYEIHCVEKPELIERINQSIRDAWEADERKIEVDKRVHEEQEALEIEKYGITLKECAKLCAIKEKSPEYKDAQFLLNEAERKQREFNERHNGKA